MTIAFAAPGTKAAVEEGTVFTPRFDANGLIACIAVDATDVLLPSTYNKVEEGDYSGLFQFYPGADEAVKMAPHSPRATGPAASSPWRAWAPSSPAW